MATRKTIFYRVSGCLNAAGKQTSIGMRESRLAELLPFAYGDKALVNSKVREASRDVALVSSRNAAGSSLVSRSWSQAVTARALAKLQGAYSPARAAELKRIADEAAALAAENNQAWEQVAA